MDLLDRRIVNALQDGLPVVARPYVDAAERLGIGEADLLERIGRLLESGTLSRFGPMYNAERLGGTFVLAALAVPETRFGEVADLVNGYPEVAHNYARDHALNMWFVVATESPARADEVMAEIEARSGLVVHAFPKIEEFYVGLRLEA